MDFISCRNVLIYMEPYLQKALHIFHYSLSVWFFIIWKSETTSGTPELFELIDKSDKLFMQRSTG